MNWVSSGYNWLSTTLTGGMTGNFIELVKSIKEARSKQKEDKIIKEELSSLKILLSKENSNPLSEQQLKEIGIRLIYCNMLSHVIPDFGVSFCIKLIGRRNNRDLMRLGFFCLNMFLKDSDESGLLLVSTLTSCLQSRQDADVWIALTALSQFCHPEGVVALVDAVRRLQAHPNPIIRKKAMFTLQHFWTVSPDSVINPLERISGTLCDADLSVSASSLHFLQDLIRINHPHVKELVPTLVSVLQQINERKFPRNFEFNRACAPWVQIELLKILGNLGKNDSKASSYIYEVVAQSLQTAEQAQSTAGYAVVYECALTLVKIHPSQQHTILAANAIAGFLTSSSPNLKYLGLKGLAEIVKVDAEYVNPYQEIIVDSLEDSDSTIKRKTLDLLCAMSTTRNVVFIVGKLIEYLKSMSSGNPGKEGRSLGGVVGTDPNFKKYLVDQSVDLILKLKTKDDWVVSTLLSVLVYGGDSASFQVEKLLKFILQGGKSLGNFAVDLFLRALTNSSLSEQLIGAIATILGEFGENPKLEEILNSLSGLLAKSQDNYTKCLIVTAIGKICGKLGTIPENIKIQVENSSSTSVELIHRCSQFKIFSQRGPQFLEKMLGIQLEKFNLNLQLEIFKSYLDEAPSGKKYVPKEQRQINQISTETVVKKLRFSEYDAPPRQEFRESGFSGNSEFKNSGSQNSDRKIPEKLDGEIILDNVVSKWGPDGYMATSGIQVEKEEDFKLKSQVESASKSQVEVKLKPQQQKSPQKDPEKLKMMQGIFGNFQLENQLENQVDMLQLGSPKVSQRSQSSQSSQDSSNPVARKLSLDPIQIPRKPTEISLNYLMDGIPLQLETFNLNFRSQIPRTKTQVLVNDGALEVSYLKVYENEYTLIVLALKNIFKKDLTRVKTKIDTSVEIQGKIVKPSGEISGKDAEISEISPGMTYLVPVNCSLGHQPSKFQGIFTYFFNENERMLSFEIKLEISDFVRPRELTEAKFWELWEQYSHESQMKTMILSEKENSAREFSEKLNLKMVSQTATETTFCGELKGGNLCLFVLREEGKHSRIIFKTQFKDFTEHLSRYCHNTF